MNFHDSRRTYDVISGNPLDFKHWFQPDLRDISAEKWKATRLAETISRFGQIQHSKDNKECFEAAVYSVHDGYPSENGWVFEGGFFTPSRFCRGSADVTVPYAHIAPFLSTKGQSAVQALKQAISKNHQWRNLKWLNAQ